ncbi:MAG: phytoene/squalene synthase family protein [Methylorubrum extorquens]|uniref:Phytoene synthase n=1 Tax=Methylorubrum extorquens (strain DSM 6343 / CIP 106787 / DM4) TaxID=661410 RepID=C7CB10_METED|nr:phytoene/squalene synthase family protein [Methylorubrum extorquens]CAX25422.1 phytoene synthase [Methylorubrum extorquens DM4]
MPVFAPDPFAASAADRSACRAAIRAGSKSFFAASLLLPPAVRVSAYGLYAFCRLSDDAVDEAGGSRAAALARLERRLTAACAGRPDNHPADRALTEVLARHAIPEALPRALLEGLAWDTQGRRYDTLSELAAYAARVAGAVGAMMTLVMGVRDGPALARACDLGVAMQFTNIARDVGEDARAGRLYLPREWLDAAGIDTNAFLAEPRLGPGLQRVVADLLAAADELYARAEPGIAALPLSCRPAIRAAGLIYAEIGRAVEANGLDSVTRRARVTGARKAGLLATAILPAGGGQGLSAPPLPETAFLVEAVTHHPVPAARRLPPWWNVSGQVVRVLDLIEVLEERDAFRRSAAS